MKLRDRGAPINNNCMKEKAREEAKKIGNSNFKASDGWLARYKKRWHLKFLLPIFLGVEEPQIINSDQCPVWLETLPNKILDSIYSKKRKVITFGASKKRVTMMFTIKADGTKAKPLKSLQAYYQSKAIICCQPKAWINNDLMLFRKPKCQGN
eukprot:TRINITY_DN5484_c0_g1_i6.p1 TRINITY_DN5484_c0_g1~~TRINITY_DN5484_c0_g1_i6.p1  ORF type:complete len:153 (+),score=18.36 TRINITY_DN5484_c0_g1_i6:214-672(+)